MNLLSIKAIKIVLITLASVGLFACDNVALSTTKQPTTSTENLLLTVYKSPQCGCCEGWIDHVHELGFATKVIHPDDLYGIKKRLNIAQNMQSCHTAVTPDGLIIEGHVPVKYINQFIANTPSNALGLSVPGMVVGSPGMEVDDKFRPYKIIQLNRDGTTKIYAEINSYQQQF